MMPPRRPLLRPAAATDVPDLARLWAQAFPRERSVAERIEDLEQGLTWGGLEDCWVAEGPEGSLDGALRTYPMTVHAWGRTWPAMGLAGVAVATHARRAGLARRMCEEAVREARGRGDVLSVLYPFRASFYGDLGYVLAGELHRYRFAPETLPLLPGWRDVRMAGEAEVEEAVPEVYDRVARRSVGMLARTRKAWAFLAAADTWCPVHRRPDGRLDGYLVLRAGRGGPDPVLRVRELVAEGPEAYQALLGWLSAQRDQWAEVIYDAVPGEEFYRLLDHPRLSRSGRARSLWFHSARVLRGPMYRLLDPTAVVEEGRPVDVADPVLDDPGEGSAGAGGSSAMDVPRATRLFLEGRLPGQLSPPDGWRPALGLTDVRLLDPF